MNAFLLTKTPGQSQTLRCSHKIMTDSGGTIIINELEYVNPSLQQEETRFEYEK